MFLKRYKNLRKFKQYFFKYKRNIISLITVMIIASSMGMLVAYLMSEQLITITNLLLNQAFKFTLAILCVITIHHICWFLWSKFQFKLSKNVALDIRGDIVSNLLNTKYAHIKKNGLGYYNERINNDVEELSSFFGNVVGAFVDMATNVGFLVVIYFLSWQLGLFFSVGVGLLFLLESFKVNVDVKNLKKVKTLAESANSQFSEVIKGVKNIKSFGIKEEINNKIEKINLSFLNQTYQKNVKFEFLSRIGTFLQWVIDAGLVFMSIFWLLPSGQIAVVTLLIVFNYKSLMYDTVGFFSRVKNYYVSGDHFAERILDITKNENKEVFGKIQNHKFSGKITISNLNFSYGQNNVLNDVNLQINKNTFNILMGGSGGGKSTLFLLLSKLYDVNDNTISYDGVDINKISEKSLRDNVYLVSQDAFIFNDTILNNIKIVKPNAKDDEIIKACKKANLHKEIAGFAGGYNTMLDEGGTNLSGGQKQRIEIARAILKSAKIILLDEPTSALDNKNQKKLFDTLKQLSLNKTIFVVAHKVINFDIFDNIFEINNGTITKIN